ncbi:hypothetical protein K439DRAFT_1613984 [Ramaria rubella]|nr:hypothetical protein K439DRAFT_1613984 [Ramaria rubella]
MTGLAMGKLHTALSLKMHRNYSGLQGLCQSSKVSSNLKVTAFYSDQPAVVSFPLHDLTKLQLPPANILHEIIKTKNQAWLDGNRSIIYANVHPNGGKHVHYPFWLVVLWGSIKALRNDVIDHWLAAELFLCKLGRQTKGSERRRVVEQVGMLLIHYHGMETSMVDLLHHRLSHSTNHHTAIEILPLGFFARLRAVHTDKSKDSTPYGTGPLGWLKHIGDELGSGMRSTIFGAVFIDNNHWVSVTVKYVGRQILYGDPFQKQCPGWLQDALQWWLAKHTEEPGDFDVSKLKSTKQMDGFSCGILMMNALNHHFFPKEMPLVPGGEVDFTHLEQLLAVIKRHLEHYSVPVPLGTSNAQFTVTCPLDKPPGTPPLQFPVTPPQPLCPLPPDPVTPPPSMLSAEVLLTQSLSGLKVSVSESEQVCSSSESMLGLNAMDCNLIMQRGYPSVIQSPLPVSPFKLSTKREMDHSSWTPPVSPKKKKKGWGKDVPPGNTLELLWGSGRVTKLAGSKQKKPEADSLSEPGSDADDSRLTLVFKTLVDDIDQGSRSGRPQDTFLREITRKCHTEVPGVKNEDYIRCLGQGCKTSWTAPRNKARILRHCAHCSRLPSEQRREASRKLGERGVGTTLEVKHAAPEPPSQHCNKKVKRTPQGEDSAAFVGVFGQAGKKQLKKELDFAILKLICASGIPPSIARSDERKEVWKVASPYYQPASTTMIEDSQIPAEAAQVCEEHIKLLKTQYHLTISFDGGSICRPQAVETVHVTTADRESFLVAGHEESNVSHTSEHIEGLVTEVIDQIGWPHFSTIASDGAKNSKGPRTIKDLCGVLSFFKHSTYSTTHLTQLHQATNLGGALESIGKTRFATICWSAMSVQHLLPAIRHLVTTKQINMKKLNNLFIEKSTATIQFEFGLTRLIMILLPFAKAILCFEAAHLTASDVYTFWLAITANVKDLLEDGSNDFEVDTTEEIRAIVNYCFHQHFQEGHGNVYVAAFYLDPCYLNTDILLKPNSLSQAVITLPSHPTSSRAYPSSQPNHSPQCPSDDPVNSQIFQQVGNYLGTLLQAEFKTKTHPSLCDLDEGTASEEFKSQFTSFSHNQYPFTIPIHDGQSVLDWWCTISPHPLARTLAFVAIKLFSVVPSSMADKHTMSVFTWLNSPLCNRQDVGTLVDMIQIRQWHQCDQTKKPCLHPVPKFGNLKLNPKDVKHQEDLENDLDAVDDPAETVEWLDGENETIDANRTGFDIEDSVDLQSETLRMLLANSSMQPL